MKKIKNAVTKHRIFTSINVTHINSRKKEAAHAGYGRSLPSAFSHGVSVPDVTDPPAGCCGRTGTGNFLPGVSSIHRYDGSCKITTWLCAIAKNQYLSYLRKHPLHEDLTDTEAELPHTPSAEQEALSSAGKMELLQCLHQFQEPYREVIYLRVFGNLSFREIGQIMGQSENWARVMFYRSKERLRKELNKHEK